MRKTAAAVAAALIAASAAVSVSYAESETTGTVETDDPFEGCFEQQEGENWKITEKGVKLLIEDTEAGGLYDLHVSLKEPYDDSISLHISLFSDEKTYSVLYIAMQAQQEMFIPVTEIVTALKEQYPEEEIPFGSITYGIILDSPELVSGLEFTLISEEPEITESDGLSDENGDEQGSEEPVSDDDNDESEEVSDDDDGLSGVETDGLISDEDVPADSADDTAYTEEDANPGTGAFTAGLPMLAAALTAAAFSAKRR